MHCLPGIVSEREKNVTHTHPQSVALKAHIDQISTQRTAFAGRASDQLKELLSNFQVIPLKDKSATKNICLSDSLLSHLFMCDESFNRNILTDPISCPNAAFTTPFKIYS